MLTRFVDFVRGKLTHPDLDGEFNHEHAHINRLLLSTPLNRDLDFNGFLAKNFRATQAFEVRNAAEFASISEAIQDIGSGNPGVVWLPPNTVFDEDATITVPDDISIVGANWSSVVRPTFANATLFDVGDSNRVQLIGFKIDGNNQTTSAVPAIDAATSSASDFLMRGVWVTGWGNSSASIATLRHGVDLRGNSNGRVIQSKFDNIEGSAIYCGGQGGSTSGFSQLVAQNDVDLDGGGQHGIYVWTGYNVKVIHNVLNRIDFSGIFIDGNTTGTHRNVDVSWNQIHSTGNSAGTNYDTHGITAKLGGATIHGLRISNNQLYSIGRAGFASDAGRGIDIDVDAASSTLIGLLLLANEVYSCQQEGIRFFLTDNTSTATNIVVTGNELTDFSSQSTSFRGIDILRDSTGGNLKNLSVRNNTIGRNAAGNFTDGIRIADNKDQNDFTGIVSGNQIYGTTTASGRPINMSSVEGMYVGPNAVSEDNPAFT